VTHRILNGGETSSVTCDACGWHGTRSRSTTQPCPGCGAAIDWRPVLAQRRVYQRRHDVRKEELRVAETARLRAHLEAERAKDATELARIDEQLRQAREAARR
jgi:predicted RNA-binding Zn-ribbon protein involved in translation (DUF1610 family)